ncbi:MAG: hypothetical protein RBT15_04845 [Gudongella sp.]|jgi:hypothetical protein|nr:hypothetical protein [Gudongella sp.]
MTIIKTIKIEITQLDNTKKVYEVRYAREFVMNIEGFDAIYLAASRLSDGAIGYIPTNTIRGWRILTDD